MRRLAAISAALLFTFAHPAASVAENDSHTQVARDVVELMGVLGQARAVIDDTASNFADNLVSFTPNVATEDYDRAVTAASAEYVKAFRAREQDFVNGLADIYRELYSEAELEQLKAFYQTPMGKKLADRQRELMTRHLKVVREIAKIASLEATVAAHERLNKLTTE